MRTLTAFGGLLGAAVLAAAPIQAASPKNIDLIGARIYASQVKSYRIARGPSLQARGPRPATLQLRATSFNIFGVGDGSPGDRIIAFGTLHDAQGTEIGRFQWRETRTGDDTSFYGPVEITLRYTNKGIVVLNGTPSTEGSPAEDTEGQPLPAVPITGTVGKAVKKIAGSAVIQSFDFDTTTWTLVVGFK